MYITRPLSLLRKFPNALSAPPEGPNSGYLVIQDEEAVNTCCFGRCEDTWIYELPFPQDKHLTIEYRTSGGAGHNHSSSTTYRDDVVLIPVLNEPLPSNRYYAIQPRGRHKGEAYANSKQEDTPSFLCFHLVRDADLAPLRPYDPYQQFVIYPYETMFDSGRFCARSIAQDGYPPGFLERKGWKIYWKTPKSFYLDDAPGIDGPWRKLLPSFDFPISRARSDVVVVGKWYCPFMFVKDGTVGDQINKSMYYGMSLEQRWERIYTSENDGKGGNRVTVDVVIQNEVVSVAGTEAVDANVADGVLWWRSVGEGRGENRVGLSLAIVERMKWEEKRVGWVNGDEKHHVKVNRVEEFDGGDGGEWKRFGCYVLVERFVLRRMDGSPVLAYDFKHPHQLRNKWE
ncbi:uncharacterized protein LOC115728035 [Rhodamnia argentea]|uniref:Uncharacterized protein LOC115728035 n=1 Tax=Rhodamnia argentea TaxID=178133 RepID=A0A8B8MVV0_9MYRT|nr:uncharacterized protein LOC115728035 [Rhodamnia argentea]